MHVTLMYLLRSDGKPLDGLTLVPWQSGKPLTCDVTVAHTLAASYVSSTAREAGAAAEMAATRKSSKYAPFAPFSADRSPDSGLHELFCGFLLPGFEPQNQPGLGGFTGSVLSLPAYCSHHTTLQLRSVSRLFRYPGVPGRF